MLDNNDEVTTDANAAFNTDTDTAPATNEVTSITLNDMKNMLMVLDVCSQRGAFRGNELTSIGALHDRLAGFVAYTEAQIAAANPASTENSTDDGAVHNIDESATGSVSYTPADSAQ
jgi:hypothetical protein